MHREGDRCSALRRSRERPVADVLRGLVATPREQRRGEQNDDPEESPHGLIVEEPPSARNGFHELTKRDTSIVS
jgi:hypothetical protein